MEWSAHRSAAALVSPRSCSGSAATNRAFRGGSGSYRDPEEQRGAPPQSKTNASALLWVNLCKPAHQVRLITETSIQFDWLMSLLFPDVYRKKRKRSNYGTNLSYFRCKANKTQSSHAAKVWISPSGLYRFTSGLSHLSCLPCVIKHWCLKRYILKSWGNTVFYLHICVSVSLIGQTTCLHKDSMCFHHHFSFFPSNNETAVYMHHHTTKKHI